MYAFGEQVGGQERPFAIGGLDDGGVFSDPSDDTGGGCGETVSERADQGEFTLKRATSKRHAGLVGQRR